MLTPTLDAALKLARLGLCYLDIDTPTLRVKRAVAVAVATPVATMQQALERNGRL